MVEIIRGSDDDGIVDGVLNPNTGEPYNDRFAQDREGMTFLSKLRGAVGARGNPKYDLSMHARQVQKLTCIECGNDTFNVFQDAHPRGYGATQMRCASPRCNPPVVSPVYQLKIPDMVDYRMRQLGLSTSLGRDGKLEIE